MQWLFFMGKALSSLLSGCKVCSCRGCRLSCSFSSPRVYDIQWLFFMGKALSSLLSGCKVCSCCGGRLSFSSTTSPCC